MGAGLGSSADPLELIPGSPETVRVFARQWASKSSDYNDVAFELTTIETDGVWEGSAADRFHDFMANLANDWGLIAERFTEASLALDAYADVLSWAQGQAAAAVATHERGETASKVAARANERAAKAAEASGDKIVIQPRSRPIDPGDRIRHEAAASLADARARVRLAGNDAADTLDHMDGVVTFFDYVEAATPIIAGVATTIGLEGLRNSVNAAASLGNAMIEQPEWLASIAAGAALFGGGASGTVGGVLLTSTGVGAPGGVPLAAASIGAMTAGAVLVGAGAAGLAGSAMGDSRVEVWKREERNFERTPDGKFASGNSGKIGKEQEAATLARTERIEGVSIERQQVKTTVDGGRDSGRFFDGLFKKPDGTWEAIEVKSGTATRNAGQREFDNLISAENPGRATLPSGEKILITSVRELRG